MFYKVVFWILFAVMCLAFFGYGGMYLLACMMGMPDCIF